MSIISWIILGLIAGFIGSKIVNAEGQGFWLNIALGIIGALVGGFLFDLFGATGITGLNIWSFIVAIVGSVVVLWVLHCANGPPGVDLAKRKTAPVVNQMLGHRPDRGDVRLEAPRMCTRLSLVGSCRGSHEW